MPAIRLAIARLWFEGCSFTPVPTTLAEFRAREWVSGEAARAFYRGTRTEIGAAIDFLATHPSWQGSIGRCAAASPGGPIVEDDLQAICESVGDIKPLLRRFPKGGWRTKAARTHSTSMVRGGHGRCQGWYPPGSIRRTRGAAS